ncbi:hypothetical protein E2C01_047328 [Portunus trituberculatus]|uniref:Uncharacterized protein n=1 Tax=Portunus trituberculatus TaxID=210409 RepID=A0A5B7G7A1_PORTR|nr:hypothetical protein [Portunus trituberculatus]
MQEVESVPPHRLQHPATSPSPSPSPCPADPSPCTCRGKGETVLRSRLVVFVVVGKIVVSECQPATPGRLVTRRGDCW